MGRVLAAGLLSFWVSWASAGDLWLLVNGHAVHLEERPNDVNEDNYGLGLQYDQEWRGDWLWFLFSSGFQSSQNEPAYDMGAGLRRRYPFYGMFRNLHLDLGAAAMVIAHDGYRDGGPVPALLPVASLGGSHFALNAAFVPPVDEQVTPLVFFQLMYSLGLGATPTPASGGATDVP